MDCSMKKKQNLVMQDIARMAGVSESTVSRALAGSPLVAQKTRARILELARAARYTVNESARNLRQRKSRTIEVVIPIEAHGRQQISDPFFLDMLGSIADALALREYDMLLSKRAPWANGGRRNPLLTGRADGIIIIGQGRQCTALANFARDNKPVAVWGAHLPGNDYVVVGSDNRLGGKKATAHLLQLGRRRIAFLGDTEQPEIALRHQGYLDALHEAGVKAQPALSINAPFDSAEAFAAAKALIESGEAFDAIVAASDVIAMSAIAALRQAGIAVPEDVSVTGYDNIASSAWFSPPLTTISQSIDKGGAALVEALFDQIKGGAGRSVVLPAELIVRGSCGKS